MGKALGRHASAGQAIVTDRRGGGEAFFYISGIEELFPVRVIPPHAGETIGLQLELDRERVCAGATPRPLLSLLHLAIDAEQVLHVMADFMRYDIGLREITRRAKPFRELGKEPEVQVDLPVCRAIERSRRRLGRAAGRPRGARCFARRAASTKTWKRSWFEKA